MNRETGMPRKQKHTQAESSGRGGRPLIYRPDTKSRWWDTRLRRVALLLMPVLFVLFQGSIGPAQTPHLIDGYDTTTVLCCGQNLDGKPFCTNMMIEDCDDNDGREVSGCDECREAPDYTL